MNSILNSLLLSFLCSHVKARDQLVNYKYKSFINWPSSDIISGLCSANFARFKPRLEMIVYRENFGSQKR